MKKLQPSETRHTNVENRKINLVLRNELERARAVSARFDDLKQRVARKKLTVNHRDHRVVFDNQNLIHARRPSL